MLRLERNKRTIFKSRVVRFYRRTIVSRMVAIFVPIDIDTEETAVYFVDGDAFGKDICRFVCSGKPPFALYLPTTEKGRRFLCLD